MKKPRPTLSPGLDNSSKERVEQIHFLNEDTLERHYDDRGRLAIEQIVRNNQLHGAHKEYYPGTDKVRVQKEFDMGIKTGPLKHFRLDGTLAFQKQYVAGLAEGDAITFHKDGTTPKTREPFVADINTGNNQAYYPSGELAAIIPVVAAKPQGRKHSFYEDGTPKSVENFDNGVSVGTAYHLHPNGVVANCVVFENGEIKTEDGLHPNGTRAFHRAYGARQVYGRNRAAGLQLAWNENGKLTERVMADGIDTRKDLLAAQRELAEALVAEGNIVATAPPVFKPQ